MIALRKITEENFRAVIDMKMPPEQHFVAPNVLSLAQAWLYPEARPFAIYDAETDSLVGFVMFDWDEEERSLGIWRLMIALDKQGRGYGQQAVQAAIELARSAGTFDSLNVDYIPGNDAAEHVYKKLGFLPTGEVEDGEIVMELKL